MANQQSWRRWTAGILSGLAMLALLTVLGLDAWAGRRLERQMRLAEAGGGSLAGADYLPALNGDRNASHALIAASHLLNSTTPRRDETPWREVPLDRAVADPALVERARSWLERPQNRLVLEILDLNSSVRGARFPLEDPSSFALIFDQLASERGIPMLRLMAVLRTRALDRIAAGRADDAYADAALLLRLASWIQTELPSLLTWIIGNAVAKTGVATIEELQQIAPPSPGARARLREELTLLAERRRSWGLEADRALSHEKMLQGGLWREPDPTPSLWQSMRQTVQSWQVKAFHAQWLAGYNELIRQASLPAWERPGIQAMLDDDSPFMIPVKMLVPNLLDSVDKTDAMAMRYELALLALAWEDHRDAAGSYPDDPRALVPDSLAALPADGFSGEPLHWRRVDGRRIVYSIGVNQRDDGGVDQGTPRSGDEDDVRWRLPAR